MLVTFEAAAALVWVFVFPRFQKSSAALTVCPRCERLHVRAEALGRAADALAVGALAYLLALPFVAAGFEHSLSATQVLLSVSAVVAVFAVATEANLIVRAGAARLWPQFTWNVSPARAIGGGARWLGIVLAAYVFKAAYSSVGISTLFGGTGVLLTANLPSTGTVSAAAFLLVLAMLGALLSRWLVPLVFHSIPITLALRRRMERGTT